MQFRLATTVASFALLLGFAACSGKKEASQMSVYATEMCACKDVACADAVFAKLESFTTANDGKKVQANLADAYNRELDRTQKCYDKLQAAAQPK